MESDLSTRTMGTDLPSPLVERRSVCGITLAAYAIPVAVAYATLAGLPPQVGVYGYLLGGLGYALFGSSQPLGHWADFRDLAYGWGFRRAPGHGRSGPVCSDCDPFSICSGRYVHLRMAIAAEYSHQLHQRNSPAWFQGWCRSQHRGNVDSRSARHSRWWAQLH